MYKNSSWVILTGIVGHDSVREANNMYGIVLHRQREAPTPQPGPAAAALPPQETCEWRHLATVERVVSAASIATAGQGL